MKTRPRALTIVLIEDNPADARMVRQFLTAPRSPETVGTVDMLHFECIEQAMGKLDDPDVDAIVIGLEGPKVSAFGVLEAIRARVSGPPSIVLVRSAAEEFGVEAIRRGAQDCLFKDDLDGVQLTRAIRYGTERNGGRNVVDDSAGRHEVEAWVAMCSPAPLSVALKSFGHVPLKDSAPGPFAEFVSRHQEILDLSLEEREKKTNKGVVEELRSLADQLGRLGAGPRDIVGLHTAAIVAKLRGQPVRKAKAYVVDGRLLLLKLMGDLASHYRSLSWGKVSGPGRTLPVTRGKSARTPKPGMPIVEKVATGIPGFDFISDGGLP